MENFKNIFDWSAAMLKRGYKAGEDSKGPYYIDKLGFKHRYKENKGGISEYNNNNKYGNNNKEIDSINDWQKYTQNNGINYSDRQLPEQIQQSIRSNNSSQNRTIPNFITEKSFVLNSVVVVTKTQNIIQPVIPRVFTELDDMRSEYEKHKLKDKLCICQRGLSVDLFQEYFDIIHRDYIFNNNNMIGYDTYKTLIKDFLAEFDNLSNSKYEINNCYRKAHMLAQMWVETDNWQTLIEYASGKSYDPPFTDKKTGKKYYEKNGNSKEGDGPKYKGRGCFHLTWKDNYKRYQEYIKRTDLIEFPERVANELFLAVDSAGWFWTEGNSYGNLNPVADRNDGKRVSLTVNGGYNKMSERIKKTNELLKKFNANHCINMKK